MKSDTLIVLVAALLFLSCPWAYAANPAPYTEEAYKKIESVGKYRLEHDPPRISKGTPKEEKIQIITEYFRECFRQAGYSYDDTIVKVVDDLRNKNIASFPEGLHTIPAMIVLDIQYGVSECHYDHVDCLKFYTPEAAEAIQWLTKAMKLDEEPSDSRTAEP
jgi:hypothetical protein